MLIIWDFVGGLTEAHYSETIVQGLTAASL